MAMEPAGTAVSGPPEMPTDAAEILIVLEPYPVSGDIDGRNDAVADPKRERGWISRHRARRSQRPE